MNRTETSGAVSSAAASAQENPQVLFQQVADASNIPMIGSILQRSSNLFPLPALVAIGIALLLVIYVLWIIKVARHINIQFVNEKTDEAEEDEQ